MIRDKELHHESIIAAAAGMSVSGLYKHFICKEEMFYALTDPAYQGLLDLFRREVNEQEKYIETGDTSCWDTGRDAKVAVAYIYDHLDAFRLIICRSQGTKYENLVHDLAELEESTTLSFMETLKKEGAKIDDFSRKELHLLTTVNISAIFQTVEHDLTREEALHYAETLDRFFSKAWREFFGY